MPRWLKTTNFQILNIFLLFEGRPKPAVTWWHNGTILDSVIDSGRTYYKTVNQLIIKNTPRRYKGTKLECRASSSEMAGYVTREVPLTVFCKYSNEITEKKNIKQLNRLIMLICLV